jgi:hypothetical protein
MLSTSQYTVQKISLKYLPIKFAANKCNDGNVLIS